MSRKPPSRKARIVGALLMGWAYVVLAIVIIGPWLPKEEKLFAIAAVILLIVILFAGLAVLSKITTGSFRPKRHSAD